MARTTRPSLTLAQILDAAAAVLEREGYAGLTMRAVAAELGVQAPAIYWYVKDKQALELALFDHLQESLVFEPKGLDWRDDLRGMGHALHAHMLAHRDIVSLLPHGFFYAPKSMARLDTVLGVLLRAGMRPHDAAYAFTTAFDYVANWARGEWAMRARPPGQRPGLDEAAKAKILSGDFPNVAVAFAEFTGEGDLEAQFRFGLETLIAGFERLVAP